MKKLNESDFSNLTPRAQPYEVRVEVDLALRIFPNGSKTWVYIYFDQTVVQRETLGIYPEMPAEQAYLALEEARQATSKADAEQEEEEIIPPPTNGRAKKISAVAVSILATALVAPYLPFDMASIFNKTEPPLFPTTEAVTGSISSPTETLSETYSLPTPQLVVEANVSNNQAAQKIAAPTATPVTTLDESPTPTTTSVTTLDESPAPTTTSVTTLDESPTPTATPVTTLDESPAPTVTSVTALDESPIPTVSKPTIDPELVQQSNGLIKRAQFTSGIQAREPIDRIDHLLTDPNDKASIKQLYFFTEVAKLEGHTIYHQWRLNGEVVAEIPFEVKSNWRWRVFSSKKIVPSMRGDWQVNVVDEQGNILHSEHFSTRPVGDVVNTNASESEANKIALFQL